MWDPSMVSKIIYFQTIFLLFLITSHTLGYSQNQNTDSLFFILDVKKQISNKNFASAHYALEDRINHSDKKLDYICLMIENCLKNHYRNENYDFFYLKDLDPSVYNQETKSQTNPKIARVRHPIRLLQWAIDNYPEHSLSYKLMGDYYDLQLQGFSDYKIIQDETFKVIEENVFTYYNKAEKLGYKDSYINNWLGEYYLKSDDLDSAQKYFSQNLNNRQQNAISYYRLAEIFFKKKLFTQAYLHSQKAISNFDPDEVYLKYDATLLAAWSVYPLGETDKYLSYVDECIQMLPNEQGAYIELYNYYSSHNENRKSENILKEMLLKNPFELKGYRVLEEYVTRQNKESFSDSLFDAMQVEFDTWDEVMANIYWSKGNIAFMKKKNEEAQKFWEISRSYMRRYLPDNSPILKQIGDLDSFRTKK
jgi:hypothetical protein